MALIDDFKARFTEFDTATVDSVFSKLESSYPLYYVKDYATHQEQTLQLLAHLFVVETIMNKTMGGVKEEDKDDSNSFFKLSKYGQTFLMLIRNNHGGMPV